MPGVPRCLAGHVLLSIVGVFVVLGAIGAAVGAGASGNKTPAASGSSWLSGRRRGNAAARHAIARHAAARYAAARYAAARYAAARYAAARYAARPLRSRPLRSHPLRRRQLRAATTAPPAPSYTVAQQQAIDAAEGYISDGQGFLQGRPDLAVVVFLRQRVLDEAGRIRRQ